MPHFFRRDEIPKISLQSVPSDELNSFRTGYYLVAANTLVAVNTRLYSECYIKYD